MAKILWTERPSLGPRRRAGHALAYDTTRQTVVMFGGAIADDELAGDTWVWDGQHWTQFADIGPSRRSGHAMAYDARRSRIVLFGGRTQTGTVGDTWEWDGELWTQVANGGPGSRTGHALSYDSARERVTLFGGADESGAVRGDTWDWDGEEWTQRENAGPPPRCGHAMTVDIIRRRLVLFGGAAGTSDDATLLDDTWEWDGTVWTQEASFGPAAAYGAAMTSKNNRVVLFGGIGAGLPGQRPVSALTWEWSGKRWTVRQDMGPAARFNHAMVFDTSRFQVVLFGGQQEKIGAAQTKLFGDVWVQPDAILAAPPPGPAPPEPAPAQPSAPFDITVLPAVALAGDQVELRFTLAPQPVTIDVTVIATTSATAAPAFLANVSIPANLTEQTAQFTVSQIKAALGPGFSPPRNVEIIASADGASRSATLRIIS